MQTIRFEQSGDPIVAEVNCGYAQDGAYTLYLWEADSNTVVEKWRGNYLNSDDDAYKLPGPNRRNDGRLVEYLTTIVVTPPIQLYAVYVEFTQGGQELGVVGASGETDQPTVTLDLFARLEAE